MFSPREKVRLSAKSLSKKINWQLVDNFFTLDEFKKLTDRQAYKVIKLIAKTNKVKLTRDEIKNVVSFIKNDFKAEEKSQSINKLWSFALSEIKSKEKQSFKVFWISFVNTITYRIGRFDLLRI